MKIAFLIQDVTTQGGTERTTCCLASEMAKQGEEVTIVSVFHEAAAPLYPLDERVRLVFITDEHYGLDLGVTGRLMLIRKQIKRIAAHPVLREADRILSQKFLASLLAYKAGLQNKTFACEHYKYGMYNPAVRFLRDRMYRAFRGLVTLTENDRQAFIAHGVRHVHVVENMVSITPLPYQGADSKRFLSVGRLDRQKGYDLLLQALALIKEEMNGWQVDIFGDGPERETLLTQRRDLGLNDIVSFHPFTKQIEQQYATHAVYVMSSRFEGFPMVLLEAAAAGLPIVSFACKEGPETLLRNGGGLLVEAENPERLADALRRLIQEDEMRRLLAAECEQVVAPYRPEAIYRKWKAIL